MAQFLLTEFLGLPTLGLIISAISSTILQILVPILLQISWIFQNTPNICILDEFEASYGRFSTKGHFFWDTLYRSDENHKLTHSHSLSHNLPILHSSNLTLFRSYTLPIFQSYICPILHSSNLTLFNFYNLVILQSCTLTYKLHIIHNVDTRIPIGSKKWKTRYLLIITIYVNTYI